MYEWITTLKNGLINITDEDQSVDPSTFTTEGNAERVLAMILDRIFDG
jgi:hypothetical protein